MIEPILLAAIRIFTFQQERWLTNASGFLFERDNRLYLVTSRHVVFDEPSGHFPDRLQIELHTNADNLAESTGYSIPLYRDGQSIWRQGMDAAGAIDVAVVEIAREALPQGVVYRAFTPAHLLDGDILEFVDTAAQIALGICAAHRHARRDFHHRTIGPCDRVRAVSDPVRVHIPIGRGAEPLLLAQESLGSVMR